MALSKEVAEDILLVLTHMRLRPCMFFMPCDTYGIMTWWNGFAAASKYFGVSFENEIDTIIRQKGWSGSAGAPFSAMQDAGLTEAEMIVEYITILIQAVQIKSGLGNEIIFKHHAELRQRVNSETIQLIDKIEADMQNRKSQ